MLVAWKLQNIPQHPCFSHPIMITHFPLSICVYLYASLLSLYHSHVDYFPNYTKTIKLFLNHNSSTPSKMLVFSFNQNNIAFPTTPITLLFLLHQSHCFSYYTNHIAFPTTPITLLFLLHQSHCFSYYTNHIAFPTTPITLLFLLHQSHCFSYYTNHIAFPTTPITLLFLLHQSHCFSYYTNHIAFPTTPITLLFYYHAAGGLNLANTE